MRISRVTGTVYGDHGVTGKFLYLTMSIVNGDLRLPLISIPSPMGNDMPSEISSMLGSFI